MTGRAELHTWLPGPLDRDMERAVERLLRTEGVAHVALMPDAHLAEDVCVGTVLASEDRVFPDAVGGDIGCGMRALALDVQADAIDRQAAADILNGLHARVPILKHARGPERALPPAPSALRKRAEREGRVQLGTLGRGNHFLELQRDAGGGLWVMIHTGSRGLGPAIRAAHRDHAERTSTGLAFLPAGDPRCDAYLAEAAWARAWARESRAVIEEAVVAILGDVLGARPVEDTRIDVDHNHVQRETHLGRSLFVHRKGAMHAPEGELGVIPGSMGTSSHHVEGRGHGPALASCSHGAGRAMSRSEARRRIATKKLYAETEGVFFDHRIARRLREEAPSAYKDIDAVMRAQRELVKVRRTLTPVLVYKGA